MVSLLTLDYFSFFLLAIFLSFPSPFFSCFLFPYFSVVKSSMESWRSREGRLFSGLRLSRSLRRCGNALERDLRPSLRSKVSFSADSRSATVVTSRRRRSFRFRLADYLDGKSAAAPSRLPSERVHLLSDRKRRREKDAEGWSSEEGRGRREFVVDRADVRDDD